MLQEDAHYFAAFKKSKLYIKLLAELDLLQDAPMTKPAADAAGDADVYHNGWTLFVLVVLSRLRVSDVGCRSTVTG